VAASRWTFDELALVNQSTLGKDLVNNGPTGYFTLFLACGSSKGTLNCLKEERIVWRQFIADQTGFGNFPESPL